MVLKRKIYQKLKEWKSGSNGKNALLIKGARRVGKSYICEQFGKNEYKSMLLIDFNKVKPEVISLFENEVNDFDLFFSKLSAFYETSLYERDSLIIFDEVQKYPRARELIKYLVADGRYDYIETGSLLTIRQNIKDITIPSEEIGIDMLPLDFEEFLWAMGNETTIPFIKMCYERMMPLGAALHRKVMNDFRQYILVGGMPQAVLAYAEGKNFEAADSAKKEILELYRNDITKFAAGYEGKVLSIYDTIPGQLSKREKRYKLSVINKDARYRGYENAFMWLVDGMIVNPCYNATDPSVGLALSADRAKQKLYMADTGLLVTHTFSDNDFISNELYRAILFDKMSINEGMLMENAVAQMLRFNGHSLYFYTKVDSANRKNMIEIDFLIASEPATDGKVIGKRKICPIEVKSSAYRVHSSLDKFRSKFSKKLGDAYVLYPKDVMIKDGVIHLPLYMAMFL